MIERLYLQNCLSFDEVELNLDGNLIIFSGPSGAGKSILMEALLALFGLKESEAKLIEASIEGKLGLDEIGIDEDEPNIFKLVKQKSSRYFINHQQISKKSLKNFSAKFVNYLTLKDVSEFENENLLQSIDEIGKQLDRSYKGLLEEFREGFEELQNKKRRLSQLQEEQSKIEELKEFAKFEIQKIEEIDPKVDEYEELLSKKRQLSKKEKIEEAISEASQIFAYEHKVSEALSLLDEQCEIFDEAMNELKVIFESAGERLEELSDINIEALLDRLDSLSSLKNRHGSIEAALEYLQKKREELEGYENIAFELEHLEDEIESLSQRVQNVAEEISKRRTKTLKAFSTKMESYLNLLYLEGLKIALSQDELYHLGIDRVSVELSGTPIEKVSSGELNRIRLSFLAAYSSFVQGSRGVLIVDEIDANLSGKESMSIAKVLEDLAQSYQIFAISHQPQLSSKAHSHYLVYKEEGKSRVKLLSKEERVDELARMISGDNISEKAVEFAKSLLN